MAKKPNLKAGKPDKTMPGQGRKVRPMPGMPEVAKQEAMMDMQRAKSGKPKGAKEAKLERHLPKGKR